MKALVFLFLLLAMGGCAVQPSEASPNVDAVGKRQTGWRLSQRTYVSIEEPWSDGGFAQVAGGSETLCFEPVYSDTSPISRPAAQSLGATRIRVDLVGAPNCAVGDEARANVWIEGSPERTYVVRVETTTTGTSIRRVQGATPLAGLPDQWLFSAGAKASIYFTSEHSGTTGLRIELEREIATPRVVFKSSSCPR